MAFYHRVRLFKGRMVDDRGVVGFVQVLVELACVHILFVVFHEGLLVEAVPGVELVPGDGDDAVASPLPLRLQAFVALRPGRYPFLIQFPCDDYSALAVSQRIKNPAYRGSFRRMDDVAFFRSSVSVTFFST